MGCRQGKLECKKEEAAADGPAAAGEAAATDEGQTNPAGSPDDSPKIIVVFGATGLQGGSVVKYLKDDDKFKVRAVTRNADSDKAKQLAEQGMFKNFWRCRSYQVSFFNPKCYHSVKQPV